MWWSKINLSFIARFTNLLRLFIVTWPHTEGGTNAVKWGYRSNLELAFFAEDPIISVSVFSQVSCCVSILIKRHTREDTQKKESSGRFFHRPTGREKRGKSRKWHKNSVKKKVSHALLNLLKMIQLKIFLYESKYWST